MMCPCKFIDCNKSTIMVQIVNIGAGGIVRVTQKEKKKSALIHY